MRTFWLLICTSLVCHHIMRAQSVFVLAKGGRSLYASNITMGGRDAPWRSGSIFGIGARVRTSEAIGIDAMVEYSTHRYEAEPWQPWDAPINNPANNIIEVSTVARLSLGFVGPSYVCILGGLGVFSQKKEEIVRKVYFAGPGEVFTKSGSKQTGVGVILGAAVEVRPSDNFEFTLEGSLRGRAYVTPVVELGAAYKP